MLIVHVNGGGGRGLPRARLEEAVRLALRGEGVEAAEVSMSFLDDDEIRAMNRRYLERDRVTDVIAFTLDAGPGPGSGTDATESPPELPHLIGDIYVGLDQAERQARALGLPRDEELVRLAIHGTLHVLGYDHPEGEARDESALFRRQEALVGQVMAGAGERADGGEGADDVEGPEDKAPAGGAEEGAGDGAQDRPRP